MDLADLFSEQDYAFRMGLRRGKPERFFRSGAKASGELLKLRRRAIEDAPAACLGLLPVGEPLVDEAIAACLRWQALPDADRLTFASEPDPHVRLRMLCERIEPDLLMLAPGNQGQMHLLAGCVCFPSSWSLPEKLGRPMALIHESTPSLNRTLGAQIDTLLARLRPGMAWLRSNWGLSVSGGLNQHPDIGVPKLTSNQSLEEVWLRVERQALVALPASGGILFGIRIESERLSVLTAQSPEATRRLAQALQTMPEDIAHYKGIAPARAHLIQQLHNTQVTPNK